MTVDSNFGRCTVKICPSMQLFPVSFVSSCSVLSGELEHIPVVMRGEAGYSLNRLPVKIHSCVKNPPINIHTSRFRLQEPNLDQWMLLDEKWEIRIRVRKYTANFRGNPLYKCVFTGILVCKSVLKSFKPVLLFLLQRYLIMH